MKWRVLRYKIGCYFLSLEKKIKSPKKGADLIYIYHIYSFDVWTKTTKPLPWCFYIFAINSVFCLSPLVWIRTFSTEGHLCILLSSILNQSMRRSDWKTTKLLWNNVFFIPTKFHKNQSSSTTKETDDVNCWWTDGWLTFLPENTNFNRMLSTSFMPRFAKIVQLSKRSGKCASQPEAVITIFVDGYTPETQTLGKECWWFVICLVFWKFMQHLQRRSKVRQLIKVDAAIFADGTARKAQLY